MHSSEVDAIPITLLGITGGTGAAFARLALDRGHHLTAVTRRPERVTLRHRGLTVIAGDMLNPESLGAAIRGCRVVVSCVGVANPLQARRGTTLYSQGTRHIREAMQLAGCQRLIVVSSAGVAPRNGAPLLYRLLVKPLLLEPAYRDMRVMEQELQASTLDWTIVRPPQLTNAPFNPAYRLQSGRNVDGDKPLPRATLAAFLLGEVEQPRFSRQVVAISG